MSEALKRPRSPCPAASAPGSPQVEAAALPSANDRQKAAECVDLAASLSSAIGQQSGAPSPSYGTTTPGGIASLARTTEVVIIDDSPDDEGMAQVGGARGGLSTCSSAPAVRGSLFANGSSRSQPIASTKASDTSPPRKENPGAGNFAESDAGTAPPPLKALATEKRSTRNRSNPNSDESNASPLAAHPSTTTDANTAVGPSSGKAARNSAASSGAPTSGAQPPKLGSAGGSSLKQSTLTFGISMEGELRKALAEKEGKIEELTNKLLAVDEAARVKENELRAVVKSRESEAQQLGQALDKEVQRSQRYQQVLFNVLSENARSDRAEARRTMWEQHNELGHVATVPSTVGGVKEMWVEGHFWRESIREAEALARRKAEVDALKKASEKKLRATAKVDDLQQQQQESNGFSFAEHVMEVEEAIELYKQELDAIDRQLSDLQKKREQHDINKASFLREIRRINDEDASEFFHTETLNSGRYVVISLLGKGGFSEVWKAFDLVAARYVAVKIHKVSKDMSAQARANYLKHAERELEIMRGLEHPRLVKLYDVFELNEHSFASVMELSMGQDLDAYLKSHRFLKEHDARVILIQMVSALRYFADLENPVIHYDLKPANVLFHSALSTSFDIKITDFGLSKVIMQQGPGNSEDPSIELTSQGTGTFWYLPPETFETSSTPRISNKVDIWAVGVIFFQMLFGKRPFAEGENQRRIWHDKLIVHRAKVLEFPQQPAGQRPISNEAKELIRKCLAFDVHDRVDIVQLSNDPYLRRKGSGTNTNSSGGTGSLGTTTARRLAAAASSSAVLAAPTTVSPPIAIPSGAMAPPS